MSKKITIIGMPSAGKTTVGAALAKRLGYDFADLDLMVEEVEQKSLIEVMNAKGADYFRNMEYEFLKKISPEASVVISPAGSIIFQKDALKWIQDNSFVINLNTPFEIIEKRLVETPKAVAGLSERGLKSIWDERIPLYAQYASVTVDAKDKNVDQVVDEIVKVLK